MPSAVLLERAALIVASDTGCTIAAALVKIDVRSRLAGLSLLETADEIIERRIRCR